jgi:RHS repeat-associated protein
VADLCAGAIGAVLCLEASRLARNGRDWLSSVSVAGSGGTIYQAGYVYNDASQITSISSSMHGTLTLGYDDLYRLTSVQEAQGETHDQTLNYDAIGNVTVNDGQPYQYLDVDLPHAVTKAGPNSYAYDANGNLVSVTERSEGCVEIKRLLTWDAEDRLTSASANGQSTFYAYDPEGQRIKKTVGTKTTRYYGNLVEVEREGDEETTTKYYYAEGFLVARRVDGVATWVHQDHLDSVRVLSDAAGAGIATKEFAAFGEQVGSTGTDSGTRGYGAHWQDGESGLIYMGARYYDPVVARFVQPDPVVPEPGDPQSWNRYSFVRNNPFNRVDPTGSFDIGPIDNVGTRLLGAAGVFGGYVEASAGATFIVGGSATGIGAVPAMVVGGAIFVHGSDVAAASLRTMLTGEFQQTATGRGLEAAGLSPEAAAGAEAGLSIGGTTSGILAASRAARGAAGVAIEEGVATRGTTRSGIGVTRHGVDQKITRGVRTADELDAIKNPLQTRPVRVDELGRPSQRVIGGRAEVVRNPETGEIISVNPTSSKKAERLLRQLGWDE